VSGAAGIGLLAAGCGHHAAPRQTNLPVHVTPADVKILGGLLNAEFHAATAYTAGLPLLPIGSHNHRLAARFLNQELSHIIELQTLIKAGHAFPQGEAGTYDLGYPRDATEVLELFHQVEQLTISAYLAAIPRLSAGVIRAKAASILANEGQHVSIVRRNLGLVPVPAALVTGRE
jgi:hypothetical protein